MSFLKVVTRVVFLFVAKVALGLEQVPLSDYTCTHPPYSIHIFSKSPLVIYISNFITAAERAHLQEVTGTFSNSAVSDESGVQGLRQTRTSQSTTIPRDPVVRCIEARALLFQGLSTPRTHLEPLQLVQYTLNQAYHFHTDWFTSSMQTSPSHGGNRATSFFVYVSVDGVTGGGTNFPMLDAPAEDEDEEGKWCEYIDCDEEWEKGVTFRPVEGNAVFWVNLQEDGHGDERVLHAGLPVTSGKKLGMNIWTREGPLSREFRGDD